MMGLTYDLEAQRPKQIGMVVLQSDESLETDFRTLIPDDLEVLVSRVASASTVSSGSLRAMEDRLTEAASLMPRGAVLSAVGYGCTSASAEIGSARISKLIRAGVKTPYVTEPVSALIAACRSLGVSRIAMISPYVEEVSARLVSVLEDKGIRVTGFLSFDEPLEERVVRIAESSIEAAAVEVGQHPDCDAVFLSCTNLRTLGVIERIEAQLDKPVMSSNQVLAWHLTKLAGHPVPDHGVGRLYNPEYAGAANCYWQPPAAH